MKRHKEGIALFIVVLISIVLAGGAIAFADSQFIDLPDGSRCFDDRFIVHVKPGTPRLDMNSISDGFAVTGIFSIDGLCRANNVMNVEEWYPYPIIHEETRRFVERIYIFVVADGQDVVAAAENFAYDPNIEISEPYRVPFSSIIPNDPERWRQSFLGRIDVYNGWDIIHGDTTAHSIIGIVDTGVYWTHSDLYPNMWEDIGWDMYNNDNDPSEPYPIHGTHVAGCASEATDNSIGGCGVGWSARIMAVRGCDNSGNLTHVWQGVNWAADNGAHIINCSWGSPGYSQSEQNIINHVHDVHDALVVAAAGNDDFWTPPYTNYPSAYNHVLAVAATDNSDHKASFSNWGTWVDVSAPGVNIYSTWGTGSYDYLSGTSMSSPITAGLAALVRAAAPYLDADQTADAIINNTDYIDDINPGYEGKLGSGRINAYQTLLAVASMLATPNPLSPGDYVYINTAYPSFMWNSVESATVYHLQVDDTPIFSSPAIDNSNIIDTSFVSPDSLGEGQWGMWFWHVRAGNGETWSEYSDLYTFMIDLIDPTTPVLLTPPDEWTNNQAPHFTWEASTDEGGSELDGYFIQVDDEPAFDPPLIIDDSTANTEYSLESDLDPNQRYYWRVRARDGAGNYSDYASGTFGVDAVAPGSPIDFDASPDGWVTDPNFTLSWSDPPDSTGIAMALYKIGSEPTGDFDTTGHFDGSPADYVAESTGSYPIYVWLLDGLGNASHESSDTDTMLYDGSPPTDCIASSPEISSEFSFEVSWTEGNDVGSGLSGLYDVRYKDGEGGDWIDWLTDFTSLSETFDNTEDGHTYYFEARTSDLASNYEPFTGVAETQTTVDTSYTGPEFEPGDANGSGDVNGLDVVYLVSYLKGMGPPPPDPILRADANGSCDVNGLDATYLVNYLKGGPAPFAGDCN